MTRSLNEEKILSFHRQKEYGSPMNSLQRLLERLDKAWRDFLESYAGLSEAELLKPGVTGSWSVRDIIAHVTTWEEEALKCLPLAIQGKRPPRYSVMYGGIDAFNTRATAHKKGLALSEVLRQQSLVHHQLIDFIISVPEEYLGGATRFRHRLRMDAYGHYPKHAQAIREWRSSVHGLTRCPVNGMGGGNYGRR